MQRYLQWESSRTIHDRLSEHLRFANNPIAYNEEAIAVHYRQKYLGETAKLKYELIKYMRHFIFVKKSP